MTAAFMQLDSKGIPFWMFLVQLFFVIIVVMIAAAIGFAVMTLVSRWMEGRGW